MLIRRASDAGAAAWYDRHETDAHPTLTVSRQIEAFCGANVDLRACVVHSTSWRYDRAPRGGTLILTYLVVLPWGEWMRRWATDGRIHLQPIDVGARIQQSDGHPPDVVPVDRVLSHALDHLAMLVKTDGGVRALLCPAWHAVLRPRQPQPAGYPRAWA